MWWRIREAIALFSQFDVHFLWEVIEEGVTLI